MDYLKGIARQLDQAMGAPLLNRTPPADVRHHHSAEVGFGCPVEGCGSPYLMWHHFDPTWSERQHHEPGGMVALCRDHHPEADSGAFTHDQLREFKRVGRDRRQALHARFNWMRRDLLAVVGGQFYYDTPIAVQVGDQQRRNRLGSSTDEQWQPTPPESLTNTEGAEKAELKPAPPAHKA